MDIQRADRSKEKKRNRILMVGGGVVLLALITLGLSRLKPAAPTVEKASLYIDTVRRGPMTREVRGPGSLVSVDVRWIAASTEGRVERQVLYPGAQVKADSVILELASQEVEQAALEAEAQVRAAEADLANLKAQLVSETLTQQASAAAVEADYNQAKLQSEADTELNKQGLVSRLTQRLSALKAEQLAKRNEIEKERLSKRSDAVESQIAAQDARVDQLRALYRLRKSQLDSLHVRAGIDGILQQVPVAVGQRVGLGTNLARVARPGELKAELRIAETQAKDIAIGQKAAIDTRNGIVEGSVSRIDPAAREGTVLVDVMLQGALPPGARPDLNVDGTIELEHLDSVLFVGRPTYGQSGSTVGLFKLVDGGSDAIRTPVKLGRSSVNTVEIVEGLNEGDQVILSDMSAWDAFERVRVR